MGDAVFGPGENWATEAQIGSNWDSFFSYALAFKQAADIVVESVEARRMAADLAAYPVCFLYRHYIELMLKALLELGENLGYPAPDNIKIDHKIAALWPHCRVLLEHFFPEADPTDNEIIDKCILEFCRVDPEGQAFRYALKKDGTANFKNKMQFNLSNTRDVMNRISAFLDGSYDEMSELLQCDADPESF